MEPSLIDIELLDISPTGILIMDAEGEFTYANQQAERILGITAGQIIERSYDSKEWKITDHAGNALPSQKMPFYQVMDKKTRVFNVEHVIEWPNGKKVYLSVNAAPIKNSHGEIEGVIASFDDVTETVLKEIEIQENKKRYKDLFDNLIDEVHIWRFLIDEDGELYNWQLIEANPVALNVWGKSLEEVQGKTATEIFGKNAIDTFMPIVKEILETGRAIRWEKYFEATKQYLSMDSIPIGDYFISTGRDVTDIKTTENELIAAKEKAEDSEEKLRETVAEKEALLMEVHHRVKNNLALISAMLYLQEQEDDNEAFSDLIMDIQSRIKSIANVHELIYENESFVDINADQYIAKIYNQVQKIYMSDLDSISFDPHMEPVVLVVEEAIPLALIVNEVLTNAFKHGLKDQKTGHIELKLKQNHAAITLTIKDDGRGLPDGFDLEKSSSLGLTIIKQFAHQLEGTYDLSSGSKGGTIFNLSFEKTGKQ